MTHRTAASAAFAEGAPRPSSSSSSSSSSPRAAHRGCRPAAAGARGRPRLPPPGAYLRPRRAAPHPGAQRRPPRPAAALAAGDQPQGPDALSLREAALAPPPRCRRRRRPGASWARGEAPVTRLRPSPPGAQAGAGAPFPRGSAAALGAASPPPPPSLPPRRPRPKRGGAAPRPRLTWGSGQGAERQGEEAGGRPHGVARRRPPPRLPPPCAAGSAPARAREGGKVGGLLRGRGCRGARAAELRPAAAPSPLRGKEMARAGEVPRRARLEEGSAGKCSRSPGSEGPVRERRGSPGAGGAPAPRSSRGTAPGRAEGNRRCKSGGRLPARRGG